VKLTRTATQRAEELARFKTSILDTFHSTCDIQRRTLASNGAGGQTETWGTVHKGEKCAVNARGGDEDVVADKEASVKEYVIHLKAGLDVRQQDRVRVRETSLTYQIKAIEPPVDIEVARTVSAVLVT
jgi:head-tail adaptor